MPRRPPRPRSRFAISNPSFPFLLLSYFDSSRGDGWYIPFLDGLLTFTYPFPHLHPSTSKSYLTHLYVPSLMCNTKLMCFGVNMYLCVAPNESLIREHVGASLLECQLTQSVLLLTKILNFTNVGRCTYVAVVHHVF